jgi:hypothetical protein
MSGPSILLPLRLSQRATGLAVRGTREIVARAARLVGLAHDEAPLPDFHAAPAEPPTRIDLPPRPTQTQTAAPRDPAGAEVPSAEPWAGYRALRAADVINRLAAASLEELAAIEPYELSNRKRKTVIAAAQRQLTRRR